LLLKKITGTANYTFALPLRNIVE